MLTLDENGASSRQLPAPANTGSCLAGELIGKPFVGLFVFEVVSDDPDILEAQWEVLRASATEQRVPLGIAVGEDSPDLEVRVELEPAAGGETAWLARVTRAQREDSLRSDRKRPEFAANPDPLPGRRADRAAMSGPNSRKATRPASSI